MTGLGKVLHPNTTGRKSKIAKLQWRRLGHLHGASPHHIPLAMLVSLCTFVISQSLFFFVVCGMTFNSGHRREKAFNVRLEHRAILIITKSHVDHGNCPRRETANHHIVHRYGLIRQNHVHAVNISKNMLFLFGVAGYAE